MVTNKYCLVKHGCCENYELVKALGGKFESATAMYCSFQDQMKAFVCMYPIPEGVKVKLSKIDSNH